MRILTFAVIITLSWHQLLAAQPMVTIDTFLKLLNIDPPRDLPADAVNRQYLNDDLFAIYHQELRDYQLGLDPKKDRVRFENVQADRIIAANNQLLTTLEKLTAKSDNNTAATFNLAQEVLKQVSTNTVTAPSANPKYDLRGDVGFCFARSMLSHYLLLQKKVAPDHIAKIFAVGKMFQQGNLWKFHTATMIRGDDGKWLIIDSLFDQVLPPKEWMQRVYALGTSKKNSSKVRFYVTDPRKFQPAYSGYRPEYLEIPELKFFFHELLNTL